MAAILGELCPSDFGEPPETPHETPLCGRVVEALDQARHVQSVDGRLYPMLWNSYSKILTRIIREWRSALGWQPKDLRNCILQYAIEQSIRSDLWDQYVGHAPKNATERHCIAHLASRETSRSNAEKFNCAMDTFREHIVDRLDIAIAEKKCQKMTTDRSESI